jgi:hypothetical protein
MAATAELASTAVTVTPGGEASCEVRIANSGTVVDQFTLEVVGDASAWAIVQPAVVALFPGAGVVARIKFKPPKASWVSARAISFAVRVKSKEDPRAAMVEEGVVVVGPFHDTSAKLTPQPAKGSSLARAQLALSNRGNVRINARLTAGSPDRKLNFTITPSVLTAEPGATTFASVSLRPRQRFLSGPPKINPFKVHIHQERQPTITVDGSMQQEALIPAWLVPAVIGLTAVLLLGVVLWFLKPVIGGRVTGAVAKFAPATHVGKGTSHLVPLVGSPAQSAVSFSVQSISFAQNLGSIGRSERIMLVNSGQAPLHLVSVRTEGDFSQGNNCPKVLEVGATCAIIVTFVPSSFGEHDGRIVAVDDSVDSPQRIPLTGVSTMPLARLTPNRVNFGQNVGVTSAPQTVTLTNRGDGPLTVVGITATADFKAISHCPSVLPPGLSCPINVSFTPQTAGPHTGSMLVSDDSNASPGSHDTMRLTGFGYQPAATFSTTVLAPGANVGTSAGPDTVTVTSTGDGSLEVRAIVINGAAAGDYLQSSDCLRTLKPGVSCTVSVVFMPQGYGLRAANLTVYDNGLGGLQSIALRGTGTAARPLLSSAFLNFGGAKVGSPTGPQNDDLSDAGNGPLAIGSIALVGSDFAMTTNCGDALVAGASCSITVTFLPQGTGARSGVVTITDSAGTQRISLSGVGT